MLSFANTELLQHRGADQISCRDCVAILTPPLFADVAETKFVMRRDTMQSCRGPVLDQSVDGRLDQFVEIEFLVQLTLGKVWVIEVDWGHDPSPPLTPGTGTVGPDAQKGQDDRDVLIRMDFETEMVTEMVTEMDRDSPRVD